jgi:DNA polymerase-3 subunit delta
VAKIESRQIEAILRDPGRIRVVLLHGEDTALVAARARQLVRTVARALDDPFRVVELDRDSLRLIPEEMASLALSGGRRVVRVREATDSAAGAVQEALARPGEALLVLEAGVLPPRSKLRQFIEVNRDCAAIGCYPADAATLAREVKAGLEARGVTPDAEVVAWLSERLGSSAPGTAAEVEKLALLVGPGGTLNIGTVRACVGDAAALSLDDAIDAAAAGQLGEALCALDVAMAEGSVAVAAIRAMLAHVQRLRLVRLGMAGGQSAMASVRGLRPPVFFKRETAMVRAAERWTLERLRAEAAQLMEAETACKRTGAPAEAILRGAFTDLAMRAAEGSGHRAGAPPATTRG